MTTLVRTTASFAAACCLAACSGDDDGGGDASRSASPAPSATATATASVAADAVLELTGSSLTDLTVRPGARVLVRNADSSTHNVVAEDGSFRTADLLPGDEEVFVAPSRPGAYPYRCTLQAGMTGTLVVSGSSAPTTTGAPSTNRVPRPPSTRAPQQGPRPDSPDPGGY